MKKQASKTNQPGINARFFKYTQDGVLKVNSEAELLALGYSEWTIHNGSQFDYISQGEARTFELDGAFTDIVKLTDNNFNDPSKGISLHSAINDLEVLALNKQVSYGNCKTLFKIAQDACQRRGFAFKDLSGGYFGGTKDQWTLTHEDLNAKFAENCSTALMELDEMLEHGDIDDLHRLS